MSDSNELIFKSTTALNNDDLELLTMYFESKKHSNGGTISDLDLIDTNTLKIVFDDKSVTQRIMEKIFFKFHNYDLKCSSSLQYSTKTTSQLNEREIMLKNIDVERSVIELYAEHLSPDNDIMEINKSKIFEKTWVISYKHVLNRDDVQARFNKRPTIKNVKLELIECFKTNAVIIKSDTKLDLVAFRKQLENEIKSKYSLEDNHTFMLVQFENEYKDSSEQKSMENICSEQKLIIEYCYNFDLTNSLRKCEQQLDGETLRLDQATQTEEKFDFDSEVFMSQSRSLDSNFNSEEINLIHSEESNCFHLNLEHPLAIGICNNLKLRSQLQSYLKKYKPKIVYDKKLSTQTSDLVVEFTSEINRDELKEKMIYFYSEEFSFKVIHVPKEVEIQNEIRDLFPNYSNVHFEFAENDDQFAFLRLNVYGLKIDVNNAQRKIKKLKNRLNKVGKKDSKVCKILYYNLNR
jgi:hypothetical protein